MRGGESRLKILCTTALALIVVMVTSGCGAGVCPAESVCGVPVLSIDAAGLGSKVFSSTTSTLVRITNSGRGTARDLRANALSPFSFSGGAFPGTSGTCGRTLSPGASCLLDIAYSAPPPPVAIEQSSINVTFRSGAGIRTQSLALSVRSDNGSFNQAQGLNSGVTAMAITPEGLWAGGTFASFSNQFARRIAVFSPISGGLATGSSVTGNGSSGFDSQVSSIAVAVDGSTDVYVGGFFTSYGGVSNVNGIVRLNRDGTIDTTFNTGTGASAGFNTGVNIVVPATDGSGDVYVGGTFSSYNGTSNVNRIVRLNSNGSIDAGFAIGSGATAGFNANVYTMAIALDGSGDVYVAGEFGAYQGISIGTFLARLNSDGSLDSGFNVGAGFDFFPFAITPALDGSGDVYIGGGFTFYDSVGEVNYITRLNSDGSRDLGFDIGSGSDAGFDYFVYSIVAVPDGSGDIYVGGEFSQYNYTPNVRYIARLNSNGTLDTAFNTGSGSTAGFGGWVSSILLSNDGSGDIFVGGFFTTYRGVYGISGIARLNGDGSLDDAFGADSRGTGFDRQVLDIAPALDGSGDVYVGGEFYNYDGLANQNAIARLNVDGSVDQGFSIGTGSTAGFSIGVYDLEVVGDGSGDVYAGGFFGAYNGTPNIRNIARLNSDGSLDTSFDTGSGGSAGFNNRVYSIKTAVDGSGDIYVGGEFTGFNGTSNVNRIVRLNSNGTLDSGFNTGTGASAGFSDIVRTVAPAVDGSGDVYVGGWFTSFNGVSNVNRIARLNSDGSLDSGFNIGVGASAGFNVSVGTLLAATDGSGDLYVGGGFTTYNTATNINYIVRLNSDGTIDPGFDIGSGPTAGFAGGGPFRIVAANDGSGDLFVGGSFTSYRGNSSIKRLVRLNSDGTPDGLLSIGSGTDAGFDTVVGGVFVSCAVDGSGDIYVAGDFRAYNGVTHGKVARLSPTGSPD